MNPVKKADAVRVAGLMMGPPILAGWNLLKPLDDPKSCS
jgi:hypothetical protein